MAEIETTRCRYCEGEVTPGVPKCRHCGEWLRSRPVLGRAFVVLGSLAVAIGLVLMFYPGGIIRLPKATIDTLYMAPMFLLPGLILFAAGRIAEPR